MLTREQAAVDDAGNLGRIDLVSAAASSSARSKMSIRLTSHLDFGEPSSGESAAMIIRAGLSIIRGSRLMMKRPASKSPPKRSANGEASINERSSSDDIRRM
jgi:hypothetical protein